MNKFIKNKNINNNMNKRFIIIGLIMLSFIGLGFSAEGITFNDGGVLNSLGGLLSFSGDYDLNQNTIFEAVMNDTFIYFPSGREHSSSNRLLVSNTQQTKTVCSIGCDYTTIQEAIDNAPILNKNMYNILVSNGYYNEDVSIPLQLIADITSETEGSIGGITLIGNQTNPAEVVINSLHISAGVGAISPNVRGFSVNGTDPHSDEGSAISVYGTTHAQLTNIDCSDNTEATICFMLYSGGADINNVNLGIGSLRYGFLTKAGGILEVDNITGSTYDRVFYSDSGFIQVQNDNSVSTLRGKYKNNQGYSLDSDNDEFYGAGNKDNSREGLVFSSNLNLNSIYDLTLLENSGLNNFGSITGNTLFLPSGGFNDGGNLYFDGDNDYVDISNIENSFEDGGNISISLWVKPTSIGATNHYLINLFSGGSGKIALNFDGSKWEFLYNDGVTEDKIEYPDVYTNGVWYHIGATINSEDLEACIYVNNDKYCDTLINEMNITKSSISRLGIRSSNDDYEGYMDEVKIYNRSLSESEMFNIYDEKRESLNPSINSKNGGTLFDSLNFEDSDVYIDRSTNDFILNGNQNTYFKIGGSNELLIQSSNIYSYNDFHISKVTPLFRLGLNDGTTKSFEFGSNAVGMKRISNSMEIDFYDTLNISRRSTQSLYIDNSNQLTIENLKGSYTGGSAYVCVFDSGILYTSETACP